MKKIFFLAVGFFIMLSGCTNAKEENLLKAKWTLEDSLKPSIAFERSKENNNNGIFYIDSQISYEDFIKYIKTLEDESFSIDWRYSDTDSIEKIEQEYLKRDEKDNIFSDGYINIRMCREKTSEKEGICFFMQWADKETYNKLNPDSPTSYSFKLETEAFENQE